MAPPAELQTFYKGWAAHQELLTDALRGLTDEQLGLRAAPQQWAIWQIASHIAGTRAYWLHDVLEENYPSVREMFRVERTTVPGLSLADAGWEDDEDRARTAAELLDAYERTWAMVEECLGRWSSDDLQQGHPRLGPGETRAWVVWHLMEHDVHHGGEISNILGSHGLPALDL